MEPKTPETSKSKKNINEHKLATQSNNSKINVNTGKDKKKALQAKRVTKKK